MGSTNSLVFYLQWFSYDQDIRLNDLASQIKNSSSFLFLILQIKICYLYDCDYRSQQQILNTLDGNINSQIEKFTQDLLFKYIIVSRLQYLSLKDV